MTMIDTTPSRRSVLAGLGGLTFCIAVGNDGVRLMSQAQANALANASVTPWVRIAPDGRITILSAGAEMGQGSMTSLPLIVAEEMDADWSKVAIEWTPADAKVYGYKDPFGTEHLMWIVGSRAVQLYFTQLRMAGAQVRKVLIANAAQKWGVDAATLKTEPSVVINPAGGRSQGTQGAQGFPPDRQVGAAARHAVQSQRHGAIRHRREIARHGLCLDLALAGSQCSARHLGSGQAGPIGGHAGELERRRDQGDERRDRGGQARQRRCRCRRSFRDRQGRPRRPKGDVAESQGRGFRLRPSAR